MMMKSAEAMAARVIDAATAASAPAMAARITVLMTITGEDVRLAQSEEVSEGITGEKITGVHMTGTIMKEKTGGAAITAKGAAMPATSATFRSAGPLSADRSVPGDAPRARMCGAATS